MLFTLVVLAILAVSSRADPVATIVNDDSLATLSPRNGTSSYCPEIEPPPKDFVCGELGFRKHALAFEQSDALPISYKKCVELCLKQGNCLAFEYAYYSTLERMTCFIQNANLTRKNYLVRKEGTRSWSRYCWNCSSHCPSASGSGILQNPGFETGSIAPWQVVYADDISVSVVSSGSNSAHSLRVDAISPSSGSILDLTQKYITCPGTRYLFSIDIKIPEPYPYYTITIYVGNIHIQLQNSSTNNSWETFSGVFVPQDDAEVDLTLEFDYNVDGNFSFFFDNIQAVPDYRSIEPDPGAIELTSNGGFESGKLYPWEVDKYFFAPHPRVVSPGINSKYGVNSSAYTEAISQSISVLLGKRYLFTMDYYCIGGLAIKITLGGSRNSLGSFFQTTVTIDGYNVRHQVKAPFLAVASGFIYISYVPDGSVYASSLIDNISVKELPD